MAVNKEWKCNRDGFFESPFPVCPICGTEDVQRVFLTPPSFKSDRTKFTDTQLKDFARTCNLSDFSNNQSTRHDPGHPNIWQKMPTDKDKNILFSNPVEIAGASARPLQSIATGSVKVKEITQHGGKYDAIRHAEDVK